MAGQYFVPRSSGKCLTYELNLEFPLLVINTSGAEY